MTTPDPDVAKIAASLSEEDLRKLFQEQFGQRFPKSMTAKQWAQEHGFSQSYISDVLNGKRGIADKLANALGFERRVVFIPNHLLRSGR